MHESYEQNACLYPLILPLMKEAPPHKPIGPDKRLLQFTFALLLVLHALFLWKTFLPNLGASVIGAIDSVLDEQRALVMIIELIGAGILFVDMVTRFDELPAKWRVWHVVAVGFLLIDWLFQLFVYFLDSALSMA